MKPNRKRVKLAVIGQRIWELNLCVICSTSLNYSSKYLDCLHGVCHKCLQTHETLPDIEYFTCKCGVKTDILNGLISCTLFCEKFSESQFNEKLELIMEGLVYLGNINTCIFGKSISNQVTPLSISLIAPVVLRDNYIDQAFQKTMYGLYNTKALCPNVNCRGDKFIEIYCVTCNELQCSFCQLMFHRYHKFKDIEIVMEEIRERLMISKIDLYDKLSFVKEAELRFASDMNTLKTENIKVKKEITQKFDELQKKLAKSEKECLTYVDLVYKTKLNELLKNKLTMDNLKKKYSFYLHFSESVLKKEKKVDLDLTNLANNHLLKIRQNFLLDINVKSVSLCVNVELKSKISIIIKEFMNFVLECWHVAPLFTNAITEYQRTMTITTVPNFESVIKNIEVIPRFLITDTEINRIKQHNFEKLQRKISKTSKK